MFRFFESLLEPTALPPQGTRRRPGLAAFYWHYARQARVLVVALFVAGFIVAIIDTTIPVFVGRVISLVSDHEPGSLLHDHWPPLVGMALVLLVARPMALLLQNMITNQAIIPRLSNLIRWQSHWHVVRQSWAFFKTTSPAASRNGSCKPARHCARASSRQRTRSGTSLSMAAARSSCSPRTMRGWRFRCVLWFAGYAALLRYFVPRLRVRSRHMSETRSALSGRVVDSYTNIATVKLFARPRDEDEFVRAAMDDLTEALRAQLRLTTLLNLCLAILNASLVVATGSHRRSGCGTKTALRSALSRWPYR